MAPLGFMSRRRAHSSSSSIVIHYLISAALSVLINPDTGTQYYYENVTARAMCGFFSKTFEQALQINSPCLKLIIFNNSKQRGML
jgi:hypothetical protein